MTTSRFIPAFLILWGQCWFFFFFKPGWIYYFNIARRSLGYVRLIAKALRFQDFNTDPVVSPPLSLSLGLIILCNVSVFVHGTLGKERNSKRRPVGDFLCLQTVTQSWAYKKKEDRGEKDREKETELPACNRRQDKSKRITKTAKREGKKSTH